MAGLGWREGQQRLRVGVRNRSGQRLANFFKGPDKKYSRLSSQFNSASEVQIQLQTECEKWVWLYANTILFTGTEISTSYNVHVTK